MTSHFDFYAALGLDPSQDSQALTEELDRRIAELQQRGVAQTSGEAQVALTARTILADPQKRQTYDQRLSDETAPPMDAAALRNLAQSGSFAPSNSFSSFEYQPVATPAPTKQVTRSALPELSDSASYGALWSRTFGAPRAFIIAQAIAGLVPLLTFIYVIVKNLTLFGSSYDYSGSSFDEMLGMLGTGLAIMMLPFIAFILIPVFSMQMYWAWRALYANKTNFLAPYLFSQIPIALVIMLLMLTSGFLEAYLSVFWNFIWFAATVTAIILACMPAVRAWFSNEILTVAQPQGLAQTPGQAQPQGFNPSQSFNQTQNFAPPQNPNQTHGFN